ncbi:hypothetical protein FG386_001648 [Cryptosporidium ryanae]|uniref:uncharacterized protein n=1 Tax=Cryptosporidium ryanae TaxID=515981 RepID=UPI00351A6BDA|nr:hypothetical protein FG386_001648 [Cryptosporidium ryanae]
MNVEFSNISCIKMLMHSMKYPDNIVDGVLVGYLNGENEKLVIIDSFPLSHSPKLSEYITLGMDYIQEYCNIKNRIYSEIKIGIVGYYYFGIGEGEADESHLLRLSNNLSEELLSSFQNPILVTWKGLNVQTDKILLVKLMNKKKDVGHSFENQDSLKTELEKQVKSLNYLKIVDIEDHFADPNLDFINSKIVIDNNLLK